MRLRDQDHVEKRAVALTPAALIETGQAFDRVAPGYDAANRTNPTLAAMRARAMETLWQHVAPGAHLLELGCGPATDTERLAGSGLAVTAIDASAGMVRQATKRLAQAGHDATVIQLGIDDIAALAPGRFDAALSNFGPFNCVADLPSAARALADRLRPGGVLVVSVIGRVCPWELALYASRAQWRRAVLRFAAGFVPVPLDTGRVWTHYYTPREFERPFIAAGFSRVSLKALALFAPPPYLEGFARRHPRICAALHGLDDRCGGWPVLRNWGDHFLLVLRRQ
jgi:SAM-dependent methyltransferase